MASEGNSGSEPHDRARARGVNHVTLSVRELERAFSFYVDVLGFEPVARWMRGAYLSTGGDWFALVVDEARSDQPAADYTHIALGVSERDFEAVASRIRAAGARVWQKNRSEGASLYFLDPDGHKLEIHASSLERRLASAREAPWDDIEFFDRAKKGVDG